MASILGKSHGGKRENSGRKKLMQDHSKEAKKRWNDSHKRIYFTEKIYQSWVDAKYLAGYNSCNDSDFAAHLLSLEYRRKSFHDVSRAGKRRRRPRTISTPADKQYEGAQTSTPVKHSGLVPFSTCVDELENMDCDSPSLEPVTSLHDNSSDSSAILTCGNTSQGPNCSMFSDDEGESAEEISSNEDVSDQELYHSVIEELNADKNLDSYVDSEEDSLIDDEVDYGDDYVVSEEATEEEATEEEATEEEATEISDAVYVQSFMSDDDADGPEYGPHHKLSRAEEIPALKKEINLVNERKFICSLDLLLEIFVKLCQIPGCRNVPQVKHHFVGTTLVVNCSCPSGHKFRFCSSHELNGIYVNNLQASAAVLLSGNNYGKIRRMADFLSLAFPSNPTYFRMQRLYFIPAVEEWWCWMRGELVKEFAGKDIIVGGDGQCDSPGFSAKNLCYFLVEVTSSYILEIEVRDKRHVGLASTNMEREALNNALHRLKNVLNVVELVTDASSSIKTLVSNEFKEIVHSLDVWHKSESIRKCLAKLGKPKSMKKVKDWSQHIVRHFWYCSSVCKESETTSDEEALRIMKDKWISLLHHICNSHEWLDGKCNHEEQRHDENLAWFDRRDKDFAELQKIILNPELLDSFKYYTRFRHTGSIECANNLTLVYTPKRMPLSYRAYKARKQLAAIDWNFHVNLPDAHNKSGDKIVSRKYNQRTKQWDVKIVRAKKEYQYIPVLMAKIFNMRIHDTDVVTRNVSLNASDPCLIAPTIAVMPAPPLTDLLKRRSRFATNKQPMDDNQEDVTDNEQL